MVNGLVRVWLRLQPYTYDVWNLTYNWWRGPPGIFVGLLSLEKVRFGSPFGPEPLGRRFGPWRCSPLLPQMATSTPKIPQGVGKKRNGFRPWNHVDTKHDGFSKMLQRSNVNRTPSYLGGIPGPLTVEFVKLFFGGPGHKNEQIIISLASWVGDIPKSYPCQTKQKTYQISNKSRSIPPPENLLTLDQVTELCLSPSPNCGLDQNETIVEVVMLVVLCHLERAEKCISIK